MLVLYNTCLTYVKPIVEYSSTVWDFHIKEDVYKLEMVQRRAAKFDNYNSTASVNMANTGSRMNYVRHVTILTPAYFELRTNI